MLFQFCRGDGAVGWGRGGCGGRGARGNSGHDEMLPLEGGGGAEVIVELLAEQESLLIVPLLISG